MSAIPRPLFLNVDHDNENVTDHPLHCSICCDISFHPVITPCRHVFCRECINSALQSNPCCPNDRRALNPSQLQNISGLHEYIYNRTLVNCPQCNRWTGQLQKYLLHLQTCISTSPYVQRLQDQITALQADVSALQATINNSTGPIYRDNFPYNEEDAAGLSRIISRDIHNKPSNIDANVVFNSIERCYDGAIRTNTFLIEVEMLLVTSFRSNWFTINQDRQIVGWWQVINALL